MGLERSGELWPNGYSFVWGDEKNWKQIAVMVAQGYKCNEYC